MLSTSFICRLPRELILHNLRTDSQGIHVYVKQLAVAKTRSQQITKNYLLENYTFV